MKVVCTKTFFRAPELLASKPSVHDLSAELKTLEAVHESVQASLKECHSNEIKIKKELEDKHTQAMAELKKKIKFSDDKVQALHLNWRLPRWRQWLLT
jgi:septal ring factor EnvC (AmiA/AmiB activator)